jgi:ABC-type multidrug transport system fused ATPase/permease subunit
MRGIKEFGNIEFKDVSFCYPLNQEKTIFRGLNMQFLKNKFNAIAGPTGSGKSTIIQLLLKYYSPTSGQVLIDGEDIRQLDEELLRNKVGYVGQEPTLFSGTIRDNIKVGR